MQDTRSVYEHTKLSLHVHTASHTAYSQMEARGSHAGGGGETFAMDGVDEGKCGLPG